MTPSAGTPESLIAAFAPAVDDPLDHDIIQIQCPGDAGARLARPEAHNDCPHPAGIKVPLIAALLRLRGPPDLARLIIAAHADPVERQAVRAQTKITLNI